MTEEDKLFARQTILVITQTVSYLKILNSGIPESPDDVVTKICRQMLIDALTGSAKGVLDTLKDGD